MEEPTPAELDKMLADGLDQARWDWRQPFRRRYVLLPARVTRIRAQSWRSTLYEGGWWHYTPSQARQMSRALTPVLAQYHQHFDRLMNTMRNDIS